MTALMLPPVLAIVHKLGRPPMHVSESQVFDCSPVRCQGTHHILTAKKGLPITPHPFVRTSHWSSIAIHAPTCT